MKFSEFPDRGLLKKSTHFERDFVIEGALQECFSLCLEELARLQAISWVRELGNSQRKKPTA